MMIPSSKKLTVLLAGQPNVGKSTLFNALTGSHQRIANYSGATVEKKLGTLITPNQTEITFVDLPGTYSLNAKTEDERIALDCILGHQPQVGKADFVLVVGEAYHLDRTLYLFEQIRLLHPSAILVLNMLDELNSKHIQIDMKKLAELTNAFVFGISARKKTGLTELISHLESSHDHTQISPTQNASLLDPSAVFQRIDLITKQVLTKTQKIKSVQTQKLDRWLLNPVLGPILFLLVITFLFQALFSWSQPLISGVESFMSALSDVATSLLPHGMLQSLIVDGVIAGVGSVIVFVPQIAIAFLLIGILEASGYLSRGAFLIDRFMRILGLEGRSFIPLISSFACAVPGIMATRTISQPRQRLITILVAPLMTCSARLPVYTLLIATFVPQKTVWGFLNWQGLVLLMLFGAGIVTMIFMSFVFNLILKKSQSSQSFVMELPRYRLPDFRSLYLYVSTKIISFLKTAGSVIFVLSLLLWALAYFPHSPSITEDFENKRQHVEVMMKDAPDKQEELQNQIQNLNNEESGAHLRNSYMGKMGKFFEPVFTPMGADWRMGIALISSFAAREVFVSTLGVVFNLGSADEESESLRSILSQSKKDNGEPLYSQATALAVLVFFALSAQCLSTLAVIKRETNSWLWPWVSFGYMTALAYGLAVLTFQLLYRMHLG